MIILHFRIVNVLGYQQVFLQLFPRHASVVVQILEQPLFLDDKSGLLCLTNGFFY